MRTRKILSLLFTLAQFIFFLKLIEYAVQGVQSTTITDHPGSTTIRHVDGKENDDKKVTSPEVTKTSEDTKGRACAACTGGECGVFAVQTQFPFWQLKAGVVAMIVWYFIFIHVWKYSLYPSPSAASTTMKPPTYSSGGYMTQYGVPMSSGGYQGNYNPSKYGQAEPSFMSGLFDSGIGGIFDKVVQALDKFTP